MTKYKKKFDFNYEFINDRNKLSEKVARELFKNKIIGYFNGKMEFGARALGNRSIIANPCNPKIQDIINKKIKEEKLQTLCAFDFV